MKWFSIFFFLVIVSLAIAAVTTNKSTVKTTTTTKTTLKSSARTTSTTARPTTTTTLKKTTVTTSPSKTTTTTFKTTSTKPSTLKTTVKTTTAKASSAPSSKTTKKILTTTPTPTTSMKTTTKTTPSSKATTKPNTKLSTAVTTKSSLRPTMTTTSLKTTDKTTSHISLTSKKMTTFSASATTKTSTTATLTQAESTTTTSTELTTTSIAYPVTTTKLPSPLFTLCRDREVFSSSGKVQPIALLDNSTTGDPTYCEILIVAPDDQFMQISCSAINLKSDGSFLRFYYVPDLYTNPPVLHTIYTSFINRLIVAASVGKDDWFECEWKPWNPPPNATDFKLCQQGITVQVNGTIHPLDNLIMGEFRWCIFNIYYENQYADQRIQFTCSHINLTNPDSYLEVISSLDMDHVRVTAVNNRIYVSTTNYLGLVSHFTNGDQFECKWEPFRPLATNDFKSCRDASATTANGTLQPLATDSDSNSPRWCDFTIQVSTNHSVQFSCSVVNLTTSGSFLQLRDWNGAIIADPPIVKQNYTSANYTMVVAARFTYPEWFNCQWTTVSTPPATEPQQPIFQVCRDKEARSLNGTIQPFKEGIYASSLRSCHFYIYAPFGQRIQMTCSFVRMNPTNNSNSYPSYLKFTEMDGASIVYGPVKNKIYTSMGNGMVVDSWIGNPDWFTCNWITIGEASPTSLQPLSTSITEVSPTIESTSPSMSTAVPEGTTTTPAELTTMAIGDPVTTTKSQSPLFTLCRDFEVYSSSGKVHPLGNSTTGEPRFCDMVIYGPSDQFMQMSCSTINLKSDGNSFVLGGFSEYYLQPPILNRIYTSYSNQLVVGGKFSKDDWFQCEWKPWNRPPNATDFKFCQQGTTKEISGTIHQLDNLVKGEIPRKCSFHVISLDYDYGNYTDQRAQFSCSFVNLVNPESYLQIANTLDMGYIRVPVVNRTYVSNFAMYQQYMISLDSFYTYGDQFECKWEPYIPPTTNDFKSCRDVIAKTINGTFQPFRDLGMGQPRMCDFTIQVPSGRSVQFTCSVVNLTTSESYLQLRDWNGAIIADPPVVNQNYTSKNYLVVVTARFIFPDWFSCQWTTVSTPPATEPQQPIFQMCNDHEARTFNGTLQPYKEQMTGLFNIGCRFFIYAPLNHRVQMTCSVVRMNPNYTNFFSFIKFYEMNDTEIAAQPIANEIYTSFGNVLYVWSFFTNTDWFDCSWILITPSDSTVNTKTFSISTSTTEPSNQQISTTTTSEPVPIFKPCSDIPMYTTSVKGKIQHTPDNVNPELRNWCSLLISAPSDRRIQFSCSIMNISSAISDTSFLKTMDSSENYGLVPVVNTIYTSNYDNIYMGFSIANKDWFECEWTTIPGSSTAVREFKLCRDSFTMSSFGTLQPFTENLTTNEWGTQCSFAIVTRYLNQIEISCSVINFTTPGSSLRVNDLDFPEKMRDSFPVLDRKYYVGNGATTFVSNIGKSDWFECRWATIPVSSEKTDFKLCQDSTSMVSEGTIQPIQDGKGSQRECSFYKLKNTEQFVHIYCPVVNLITPGSFLKLQTVFDEIFANPPVANEIYTVTSSDSFGVVSQFTGADSFECKWTTVLPTSQPPIQQETTTTTTPTSTIAESPSPIGMTTPVIETTTVWCATCNSIGGSCWTFSSTSGTIQSFNFPDQDYAIGARIPSNKTYFESYFFIESRCGPIKLTFNTFNVQPGGDTMLVYDGIPNPLPSGESGHNIQSLWSAGSLSYAPDYSQFTEFPPVITGKSDKMTILFLGDTLENTRLIASKRPARWQATYTIG